jgi:hypothetical protein
MGKLNEESGRWPEGVDEHELDDSSNSPWKLVNGGPVANS